MELITRLVEFGVVDESVETLPLGEPKVEEPEHVGTLAFKSDYEVGLATGKVESRSVELCAEVFT
jgi:hypothetical protein